MSGETPTKIDRYEIQGLIGQGGMATVYRANDCLLYTSDAADERSSVDLGGRRIIKKKNKIDKLWGPSDDRESHTAHIA